MNIINFIIILVILLVIDIPMITKINNKMYQTQLNRINKDSKKGSSQLISGLICYLLLALAIYIFIISPEKNKSIKSSHFEIIKKGMLLGFIIYGVYNSTNRATINEYGTKESIIDTLWGSILIGFVSYISILLIKN
jgi:uncharacterized membrane protein